MAAAGTLRITYTPLDDLVAHEANPKAHQVALVADSIRRHGFIDPVVVDERTGKLAAGHGRLAALRAMRDDGDAPPVGVRDTKGVWHVPRVEGYASANDAEAEAALIALNRTSEVGGWEDAALLDLLEKLATIDGGLVGVGYDDDEVADLRARLADLPGLDDLDGIEDEFGPLDGTEGLVTVKLAVTPATAARWDDHAKAHDSDDDALAAVLP